MENKPKRPVSVWIAQIILSIVVLLICLTFISWILFVIASRVWLWFDLIVPVFFLLSIAAFYFAGFYGMAIRRSWGRWLGVAALSLLFLLSLVGQIIRPAGPVQYYEYKNDAERFGGFIGAALMFGLFLWLILHLVLSKRVAEFFCPATEPMIGEPPPPPTFGE